MALEYKVEERDQERWEATINNIAEILNIEPEKVGNYLVIAYDGTPALKADTDLEDIKAIIYMVTVFLEHASGKKVTLSDT